MKNIKGDITDPPTDIDAIIHCCNCQNAMNSGVAKAIRNKWPEAYYADTIHSRNRTPQERVGGFSKCTIGLNLTIGNIYGQLHYGYDGRQYVNYESLFSGIFRFLRSDPQIKNVAVPYRMGCDRAGGDWDKVKAGLCHIESVLGVEFTVISLN